MRSLRKFLPLILLVSTLAACTSIDETEHCVPTRYGKVIEPKASPGLNSEIGKDYSCFPLTQQTYPGKTDDGKAAVEQVSFMTLDSVNIQNAEVSLLWRYADAYKAFQQKRSHEAVILELSNAVRSGMRDFGATLTLPKLLGPERAKLDEEAKLAIQAQMGSFVTIERVYLRNVEPPEKIKQLWANAMEQQGQQTKARAQFITDSLETRRSLMLAEAEARRVQIENAAKAANPALLAIERDKALAEASAKLLANCTTNCFIGGDALTRNLLTARAAGSQ